MKEKEEITKPPIYQASNKGAPSSKGRALFIKGAPSTIYLHLSTEREKREHVKGTQAGTRLPPDDKRERNKQFWDLWTPEEKEAQRERERLRNSWCPKRVAVVSQERWGAKRRRSSDPY
jgi:hypothetical protein